MDISNMTNGQFAGLTHFASTYSTFGVKQINNTRSIVSDNNGNEIIYLKINNKTIWLKSTWDYTGLNKYAYSLDGKDFKTLGDSYQFTWGSYRGDRIGIFNYNTLANSGFIDVDWFRYILK